MFTEKISPTGRVAIENVAVVAPAGTFTLAASTATFGNGVDSAIVVPPAGAAALRVTVPMAALPPTTVAGVTETADNNGGTLANTVSTAL